MKDFKFTALADFPFDTDVFEAMENEYKVLEQVVAQLVTGGTAEEGRHIIYGCEPNAAQDAISAGYMLVDGELVRFEGGIWSNAGTYKIYFEDTNKIETVEGINYVIYTEKVGKTSIANGVYGLYDFILLDRMMPISEFTAINTSQHKSADFAASMAAQGLTVTFARVYNHPFGIRVKLQIAVNVEDMNDASVDATVTGWYAAIGSLYGNENVNKICGEYSLFHLVGGLEQKQHRGHVYATSGGQLKLLKPYTVASDMAGWVAASWEDLCDGGGATYTRYRIEIDAELTRVIL